MSAAVGAKRDSWYSPPGTELSFYFRRPDGRHNLREQNLSIFFQIVSRDVVYERRFWSGNRRH